MSTNVTVESPEERLRQRRLTRIFIPIVILVPCAIFALVFLVIYPSPGEPIASERLVSGASFELKYKSDGNANRVFVDLECDYCGIIVGEVAATSKGKSVNATIDEDIVEFGYTHSITHVGSHLVAEGHLLLELPAYPKGDKVKVRGTLRIKPGGPGEQRIQKFTLWIAD